MKIIKNIAIILSLLITNISCDNFLEVHPEGEILGQDLLTERKGFENAMYGVYASMRENNLYGRNMTYRVFDVMAQYFQPSEDKTLIDLAKFNYYQNTDVKKIFLDIWSSMYQKISYVNNILINLENQSPETLKFYDIYKGEALGLRAFMHFDLLRIFAKQETKTDTKGIVYNTAFSVKPSDLLTKEQVLQKIISELREAERLLDNQKLYDQATENDAYFRNQNTHFNLHAARATLARVYMTIGNTDSAYYYAYKVIKESGLSLVDKTEIRDDNNGILSDKETIFGLYSNDLYTTSKTDLYDITTYSMTPRIDINEIYSNTDFRKGAWFKQLNKLRVIKLTDKIQLEGGSRPENQIPGVNLLRLPEMYYIIAECLLQNGDNQAKDYFNDILISRGLAPIDNLTLPMITDDRYKEFIGEGQSFFNMKRLNLDINTNTPASDNIYVINIPEEEFNYRY